MAITYSLKALNGLEGYEDGDVTIEMGHYLSKTIEEIDLLIAGNALIPGIVYQISGTHKERGWFYPPNNAEGGIRMSLYDDGNNAGTTIFLTALTTSELSKQGHGEFYNPKYNKLIEGFGIWNNYSTWTSTLTSGTFSSNELITADNFATGQLFATLSDNIFIVLTGD